MAFKENRRMEIWNKYHGNASEGKDPFGTTIYKSSFEADHIWPESDNGSDDLNNGIPMDSENNQSKDDDLFGNVNGKSFEVKKFKNDSKGKIIGKLYVNGHLVSK